MVGQEPWKILILLITHNLGGQEVVVPLGHTIVGLAWVEL
jgi:hypothetical protein